MSRIFASEGYYIRKTARNSFLTMNNRFKETARTRHFLQSHWAKKKKYFCHDCKHWFVPDDGFKRMRHSPEIIARAVHQHVDGFSLFKTKYHLYQHDNVKVTRWTISLWTKKYSVFLKSNKSRSKTKAQRTP